MKEDDEVRDTDRSYTPFAAAVTAALAVNAQPLRDRVLVQQAEVVSASQGGILVPDNAQERPDEGVVCAVGDGRVLENGSVVPLVVKIGDRVLYGKFAGADVNIEGLDYKILREDEILVILKTQ